MSSSAPAPSFPGGRVPWVASLAVRTVLLVATVVLVLGAAVVLWVTQEDRREALADAARMESLAESELRGLVEDLVRDHQDIAVALVEGTDRRTREWLEAEPLGLYRDRAYPERVDVTALRQALTAEVRRRSRAERENVQLITDRLGREAAARVDRVADDLRREGELRTQAAAGERRARLAMRLGLLLVGIAALLAWALWRSVLAPVARLRSAVARMAAGDLATPVGAVSRRRDEIGTLARAVDGMRGDLLRSREGLEGEVARKTADLARTLDERTAALRELEATRDRLVQAAKMASLGTLAGGLAHEFNNLLGGILGCVESARAENRDASVGEDLDMVARTANRGTRLVQGLLDVAKPGARGLEEVDLARLLDDVLRTVAPVAAQREVPLRREIAAIPPVRGDAAQLHQVALNLVTNALQAVDEREPVVVALRQEGARAVLEVRDGGPGVDPAIRDRIFEPFFTAGKAEGTGLGLFVSYGIVERHGGTLEVGSAPEGGARFTVRLPLADLYPKGDTGSGAAIAP